MQIIYIISVKGDNKKSVRNRFSINLIVFLPSVHDLEVICIVPPEKEKQHVPY